MTAHASEMSPDLLCHRCGYNLRAHPQDGKCPECGEAVDESQRAALIPRRPAWRDSDPRWRRRMLLVGVWILAFMPFMDVLQHFGWDSSVPVPSLFHHTPLTLDQTFLGEMLMRVDQPLLFCMGVVLLFAKERGRQRRRLEWTRRWGIICSYVTFLLSAALILFLPALVLTGIAALFLSMPLKYQPGITPLCIEVGPAYLRHIYPKPISSVVLVAFSSVAILLACVPLFDALRSSAGKRLAEILVAPLALFSLAHLGQAGLYCIGSSRVTLEAVARYGVYFRPQLLVGGIADFRGSLSLSGWEFIAVVVEIAKWCIIFSIAVWLTIARFTPRRQEKKTSTT